MSIPLRIRKATKEDVPAIHALLAIYAAQKVLLPRSESDISHYIANFTVAEEEGTLIGCVAVRDFGGDLLEVRSLAVSPERRGCGIGRAMLEDRMDRLRRTRTSFRLFALTCQEGFFVRQGFQVVSKEHFPEKIWSDCHACPKYDSCDEVAVLFVSERHETD